MSFVLVGSKESRNPNLQARDSWSFAELALISTLPKFIKKGFIAAKFTFKHCIKIRRDGDVTEDGRSHVGSYHLKTTLLNHLEKTPPSKIHSAFNVMMNVLNDLRMYLKRSNLPHYFLPECNLLATVGYEEQQIALQAIQDIICDPLTAILKCPSKPTEIYGDICPDDLVAAFHQVSTHPCCKRSWEDLVQLLSQLDHWRQLRYLKFSCGRPELIRLVDMLGTIKHV